MEGSPFWFRVLQVTPVLVTVILMAPLAVIFWRMVTFQLKPEAEVRAELETLLETEQAKSVSPDNLLRRRDAPGLVQKDDQPGDPTANITPEEKRDLESRVQALEDYLHGQQPRGGGEEDPSGSVVRGVTITHRDMVAIAPGLGSWFAFYPRRWVGMLGLAALALVLGLAIWSVMTPVRPPINVFQMWDAAGKPLASPDSPASEDP